MINASQEFKKLINSGVKVVNYADITLRDGTVLNLTPEDFVLGGFSMSDEMTDGKFGVGYAVGKTIDVNITGNIPTQDMQELKALYNNGFTIWHTTTYFMDYSQTNA